MYPVCSIGNTKIIFVHINKNAGSSIITVLKKKKFHLTIKELIELLGGSEIDNAFKFTVVRNPYDRVVSQYLHRVKTNQSLLRDNPISFNKWVELVYGNQKDYFYHNKQYKMFYTQLKWLRDFSGNVKVDRILRFETLNEDFQELCNDLNIDLSLPHTNRSDINVHIKYNEKSIKIIQSYFKEDFEHFGYEIDC